MTTQTTKNYRQPATLLQISEHIMGVTFFNNSVLYGPKIKRYIGSFCIQYTSQLQARMSAFIVYCGWRKPSDTCFLDSD